MAFYRTIYLDLELSDRICARILPELKENLVYHCKMFLVKMKYESIDSIELTQIRLCVNLLNILFGNDRMLSISMSQEQPFFKFLHEFLNACIRKKVEYSRSETEISSEQSFQIESGISEISLASLNYETIKQQDPPRKKPNSASLLPASPISRDQIHATQRGFVSLISEMNLLISRMNQVLARSHE